MKNVSELPIAHCALSSQMYMQVKPWNGLRKQLLLVHIKMQIAGD